MIMQRNSVQISFCSMTNNPKVQSPKFKVQRFYYSGPLYSPQAFFFGLPKQIHKSKVTEFISEAKTQSILTKIRTPVMTEGLLGRPTTQMAHLCTEELPIIERRLVDSGGLCPGTSGFGVGREIHSPTLLWS